MSITVAILAQGTMGSGVGKRLHESGAEVRTIVAGLVRTRIQER